MFSILQNLLQKISLKSHKPESQSLKQEKSENVDITPSASPDKKFLPGDGKERESVPQKNTPEAKAVNKQVIPIVKDYDNLSKSLNNESVQKRILPPDPLNKKKAEKKKSRKQINKTVNKHGIPVLKKDSDISECFKDTPAEPDTEAPAVPSVNQITDWKQKNKKPKRSPVNKNGIRIFKKEDNLSAYFNDTPHVPPSVQAVSEEKELHEPEENFEEMLEKSLVGKNIETLLREKNDLHGSMIIGKEKKIKTYPLPQKQIDLHGCTAAQAIEETEIFIQNARYKGLRTLFIIVGKGIHSNGKAVLRDVLEVKLMDLKKQNMVLDFKWEKGVKWKSGAIIVYLNDFFI